MRPRGLPALLLAASLLAACAVAPVAPGPRPATWATPAATVPELPNLHRVNATLYRSAQPDATGFARLVTGEPLFAGDAPVRTVVSLRAFHRDPPIPGRGVRQERIAIHTWHVTDDEVVRFLRIATTPRLQPVLVHCQHGADRTGLLVAVYRMAYEGWTREQARAEMTDGGFGYHPVWQNLLRYLDTVDVEALKARVAREGEWP